jgi:NAD(P)-dependent dehydrogenase (short-subunit alcohol dehydrogenase family)
MSHARYPSLKNRRVFVTGGASGIGADLVLGFCEQGAKVAYVDIDPTQAAYLNERCRQETGDSPWFRPLDVTDSVALETVMAEAASDLGGLDVLINNAANDDRHTIEACDADRWRSCLAINLDAAFIAARAAVKLMRAERHGSIINISSINAILGPPDMVGYVTAKAGINGMSKALANECGAQGIRVNSLLPGWVATQRQLDTWLTPEAEACWSEQVALKGRVMPRDITNLALFLAADDSRMITGQQFIVDAGRT